MIPGTRVIAGNLTLWEQWLCQAKMTYEERNKELNSFAWTKLIYSIKAIGVYRGEKMATISCPEGITKRVPISILIEYPE